MASVVIVEGVGHDAGGQVGSEIVRATDKFVSG